MGMTVAIPVEHIERAYSICALAAWRRKDYDMSYVYAASREVRAILHDEDGAVDLLHYVYSREAAEAAAEEIKEMLDAN